MPLVGFGLSHDLPFGTAAEAGADPTERAIKVAALRANDFIVTMKGSEKSDRELDGRVHFPFCAIPRTTTNIYIFPTFAMSQL